MKAGDLVMIKYGWHEYDSGVWKPVPTNECRWAIIDIYKEGENMARVTYLDTGNTENVLKSRIRVINESR